jgi:hypothetical protein
LGRYAAQKRRSLAGFLAPLLLIPGMLWNVAFDPAAPAANAAACSAGVVTPLHGPKAYYDTKLTTDAEANFIGYKVTPTSTLTNLKVSLAISGNNTAISLASGQPSSQEFGAVSANTSQASYFFTKVRALPNSNPASITVSVYDGASLICTYADEISTSKSTLKANANKIYSSDITGAGTTVGPDSVVYVTLTGNTGTIGSGPDGTREINFAPAINEWANNTAGFNAAAWQLVDVTFLSANTNCGSSGYVESRLYISNRTSPTSANCGGVYAVQYSFKARSSYSGTNNSRIFGFAYVASGNLIKHTTPSVCGR